MTDMIVAGAGTTAVNGTYVESTTQNGRPSYTKTGYLIFWTGSLWQIYDYTSSRVNYYSTNNVATPNLVTTWVVSKGSILPVPTVTAASSGQSLTLSCAAGSYSQTGTACTLSVKRNFALSCSAGSYAVTGTSASLTKSLVMACESGGAYPNIVVSGAGVSAANGTWVYSGMYNGKPQYTFNDQYLAWSGTLWLIQSYYYSTDDVATPDLVTTWIDGGYGSASLPTVTAAPSITYTLTGSPVTLTYTKATQAPVLTCDAGSYSQTGTSASFEVKRNFVLACGAGSYALTGTNADLLAQYHYTITCSAGSYTLTGSDISFGNTKSYELACVAGSYALTGTSVTLEVNRNFTIACNAGSYTLTGAEVTLATIHTYSLACNSGSYLLTGTPTSLTSARSLACNSGSYILTGLEADLFKGLVLPCGNGSYVLTGTPATINSARTFALGMGSYVLVGTNAGLYILTATPECRTYFIDAENRTWLINSEDRTRVIDAENRTLEVRCH